MKTLDTYLGNRELKAEFRTIVVVKNRPEGILFQGFADLPHSDPHLLETQKSNWSKVSK